MINQAFLKYFQHKEIIINFFWGSLQIFAKQGIKFIIFILTAMLLTPHEFGVYNYVLSIILFLITFSDFGISATVAKYVAEYNILDKKKINLILFNSLMIIVFFGILISLITIFFGEFFLKEKFVYILVILPLLILVPLTSTYSGLYQGLKKFKQSAILFLSASIMSILFIYFIIKNYGLIGALISQNLFYFLILIVFLIHYKKIFIKIDLALIKDILRYSLLVGLSSLGYFLYINVDIVILGYFNFIEELAYYSIINFLFGLCLISFSAMGNVMAPNNIKQKIKKQFNYLKNKIRFLIILSFILGIFLSLILAIIIPILLTWFLPQYNTPLFYNIFYIFLFILPLAVVESILAHGFITPLGYVSILTKTIILGGILNFILNFVFLYYFGYIGIILSTVIVHNLINLLKIVLFFNEIQKL